MSLIGLMEQPAFSLFICFLTFILSLFSWKFLEFTSVIVTALLSVAVLVVVSKRRNPQVLPELCGHPVMQLSGDHEFVGGNHTAACRQIGNTSGEVSSATNGGIFRTWNTKYGEGSSTEEPVLSATSSKDLYRPCRQEAIPLVPREHSSNEGECGNNSPLQKMIDKRKRSHVAGNSTQKKARHTLRNLGIRNYKMQSVDGRDMQHSIVHTRDSAFRSASGRPKAESDKRTAPLYASVIQSIYAQSRQCPNFSTGEQAVPEQSIDASVGVETTHANGRKRSLVVTEPALARKRPKCYTRAIPLRAKHSKRKLDDYIVTGRSSRASQLEQFRQQEIREDEEAERMIISMLKKASTEPKRVRFSPETVGSSSLGPGGTFTVAQEVGGLGTTAAITSTEAQSIPSTGSIVSFAAQHSSSAPGMGLPFTAATPTEAKSTPLTASGISSARSSSTTKAPPQTGVSVSSNIQVATKTTTASVNVPSAEASVLDTKLSSGTDSTVGSSSNGDASSTTVAVTAPRFSMLGTQTPDVANGGSSTVPNEETPAPVLFATSTGSNDVAQQPVSTFSFGSPPSEGTSVGGFNFGKSSQSVSPSFGKSASPSISFCETSTTSVASTVPSMGSSGTNLSQSSTVSVVAQPSFAFGSSDSAPAKASTRRRVSKSGRRTRR